MYLIAQWTFLGGMGLYSVLPVLASILFAAVALATIGRHEQMRASTAPSSSRTDLPAELLDQVDGGVLVIDSTYRIEHCNRQAQDFFPQRPIKEGAVLPRLFVNQLPERGKTTVLEWPAESSAATQVHVKAVRGAAGLMRVITLRDVTDEMRTRSELEQTDHLLRAILDTDVAAIAVVNDQGQVTYANARAEAILGLQRTDVSDAEKEGAYGAWRYEQLGWSIEPVDDDPVTRTPLRHVLDTRAPIRDMRCMVTWPSGERRYLSLNAAFLDAGTSDEKRVVFAMQDITARYRVRKQLLKQLRAHKATRDAMPALLYMCNRSGGERYWNETLVRRTGYSEDDMQGRTLAQLVHREDRARVRAAVNQVFAGEDTFGLAVRLQAKDGTLYPYMINGTVCLIDGTEHLVAVGLDVSAQGE